MNTTAKKLKEWRTRAKLSQEQAARALMVSFGTYQSWEIGRREPDGENAERVARIVAAAPAKD